MGKAPMDSRDELIKDILALPDSVVEHLPPINRAVAELVREKYGNSRRNESRGDFPDMSTSTPRGRN